MAESGGSLTPVPAPAPAGSGAAQPPVSGHLSGAQTGWTLYEVNIEIDPAVAADFDAWLPGHVDEVLNVAGFAHADILVREDVSEGTHAGWQRRTVQYRIRERSQLDDYFAQHAERLRAHVVQRFGERASFERRALTLSAHRSPGQVKPDYCANCGAVLNGQYCASCGQRSRVRIISLGHLIREAAGDLTHLDSRLWRTMRPLLFQPGQLTNEYLAGRRARFIPPFRLYLGLSIVFFVLASLGNGETRLATPGDVVVGEDEMSPADRVEVQAAREQAARELEARGFVIPGLPAPPEPPAKKPTGQDPEASPPAVSAPSTTSAPGTAPNEDAGATAAGDAGGVPAEEPGAAGTSGEPEAPPTPYLPTLFEMNCDDLQLNIAMPGRAAFEQRLRRACSKITADSGDEFLRQAVHNIPKMMFVFLPLLAFANLLLYPFSRRYYVEHLLFFVHFHAFAFLLFSLRALFNLASGGVDALGAVRSLLTAIVVIYLPIYLYKAMRRVFRQGRAATLFKFLMLYLAYNVCLMLTLMGVLVYTALTM